MWRLLNLRALAFAAVVTALLLVAIVVGSRNLQNFDVRWLVANCHALLAKPSRNGS